MSKNLPRAIDPTKLSRSCLALNPHLLAPTSLEKAASAVLPAKDRPKIIAKRRRCPNKTEQAFGRLLESRQTRGEIVSFDFEGLTLRWGKEESFAYTPDYVVTEKIVGDGWENGRNAVILTFIEIKGSKVWKDDATRFKHARDNFPIFRFEMWQCIKGEWRQIR